MIQTKEDNDKYWGSFGANSWLVEEKFEQYLADPAAVGPSWQEFFDDYTKRLETKPRTPDEVTKPSTPDEVTSEAVTPLRGAQSRIASNMIESLGVPTATSIRPIPAKLLEVNRELLNNHLRRTLGGKVSFTHIIGFAIVKALQSVPALNSTFVASTGSNGSSGVIHHEHIGLGIAVDIEKSDGTRSLMVPCIKHAETLSFKGFVKEYEDLIRKVRSNKLNPDDFHGVTVTLTNPGTIGTNGSVPRLMPGQGVIVAAGAIDYPVEFQAADPKFLATLGISKSVTLTSTYDHRIIQGAESGIFLSKIHDLLLGDGGFYEEIFESMGAQFAPFSWSQDVNPATGTDIELFKQIHVGTLINMYRVRGHLIANLDPLAEKPPSLHPELDPATYGITLWDLDREFLVDDLAGSKRVKLGEALHILRDAYCQSIGVEYMHIQEPEQKKWIQSKVEGVSRTFSIDEQLEILDRLNGAEAFEKFLHSRYIGQKRFGLEGGESAIALLAALISEAAEVGIQECLLGMAHRGRLNVMVNIVGKSYSEMFDEFEGNLDPETVQGSGDVKYHKGCEGTFVSRSGKAVSLILAANPSHLEAVDPVAEGMARAHQELLEGPRAEGDCFESSVAGKVQIRESVDKILPLIIHGDAAFAGQGVVAETLNLSNLQGYSTGGTVHLIINNQVGFTTDPSQARSSVYPTDVAKMIQAPIFHVNGDDPEACVVVGKLAFEFRQRFHKDVVIDMWCYRRYGHNEGDEPSYTQPQMYEKIDSHRSVRKLYTETLIRRGDITMEEAEKALDDFQAKLQFALEETRNSAPAKLVELPQPSISPPLEPVNTQCKIDVLQAIARAITSFPTGFTVHPKLANQFAQRTKLCDQGLVDWSLGEALAYGTLLVEAMDIRLSGQDTQRGTFSHRHSVLIDYQNGSTFCPLASLQGSSEVLQLTSSDNRIGKFNVYDSLLSEYAALGFEYGYSLGDPNALVIWEAQFGDFSNGAQTIIDEFIASASEKWDLKSGIVLLLPHGYEGQGPDHSSARLERFLQLCAEDNMRVVYPTSSAQFFHLLRSHAFMLNSQATRPLIVMSPKSLLRSTQSRSTLDSFVHGSFQPVIDDPRSLQSPDFNSSVTSIALCSGKVGVEALSTATSGKLEVGQSGSAQGEVLDAINRVAIVRIEQLYPWPRKEIEAIINSYPNLCEIVWLQEEPENMGAWNFVRDKISSLVGTDLSTRHVTRRPSGSPATGSSQIHHLEYEDLMRRVFSNPIAVS